MKNIVFLAFFFLIGTIAEAQTKTFHSFTVQDISGNDLALSSFAGKKVLVVNTASKCGLTPQYEDLQLLYEQYGSDDFVIIAFPANNFLNQEPGSDEEIMEFCSTNYDISFPVMSKISVKGDDMHPLYRWLTSKDENGVEDSKVTWNFQKYLIDENGRLVKHLSPKTNPFDKEILDFIKG